MTEERRYISPGMAIDIFLGMYNTAVRDITIRQPVSWAMCHAWDYIESQEEERKSKNPNKWIPVKWHEITDEEREREGYPKDWVCHLDSIMPYDGQRILITTKGGFVELDECYSDDGCTFSLDSGYDWVDDVIAWMPLPEPMKVGEENC